MELIDNPVGNSAPMASDYGLVGRGFRGGEKDWVRLRQPWLDDQGRSCVTIANLDGKFTRNDSPGRRKRLLVQDYTIFELMARGLPVPLTANAATMTREQIAYMDSEVVKAAREPLRAWDDLVAANPKGGFDAYSKMTYEYKRVSRAGRAYVDLDLSTEGTRDVQTQDYKSIPLLITHSDFDFTDRELAVSRNAGGPGFDVGMAEEAGRRVSEMVEDQTIGLITGPTYGTVSAGPGAHTGTSTVYGYVSEPTRLTKTNFTVPTGSNPDVTVNEILVALNQLRAQFAYGPFILYHSTDWSTFLDDDYFTGTFAQGLAAPHATLRQRIMQIGDISDVRRLDRLTSTFTFIFVSTTGPLAPAAINGRGITTITWQEKGGLVHKWKVYSIQVPLIKSDIDSRTGILHGTTA